MEMLRHLQSLQNLYFEALESISLLQAFELLGHDMSTYVVCMTTESYRHLIPPAGPALAIVLL